VPAGTRDATAPTAEWDASGEVPLQTLGAHSL